MTVTGIKMLVLKLSHLHYNGVPLHRVKRGVKCH